MYVYIRLDEQNGALTVWFVGFYAPDGRWHVDTGHILQDEAAKRVHYLNGGN